MKQDGEVKVVIFDLNGTFYNKSSKEEFYKFILKKRPNRLKYVFGMSYYYVKMKLNKIQQTEFKENFFNYLDGLPPAKVEEYAREFWAQEFPDEFNKELKKIFDDIKKSDTLLFCATGGFELYVKPLFELYEIDGLVGTQVKYDGKTYKVIGEACKEEEKIKSIRKLLNGKPFRIVEAYSDSKEVILDKAETAFLIKDKKILPYKS
mgnify:FL=1